MVCNHYINYYVFGTSICVYFYIGFTNVNITGNK